jgi:hypothetical protein
MEKEFIPYEQALALKELGFDEVCFGSYYNNGDFTNYLNIDGKTQSNNVILAPLYQQAFRWFREKYKLSCNIELTDNSRHYYFNFTIYDSKNRDYNDEDCFDSCKRLYDNRKYFTYEEAELECIKKLIEIVKSK